PEPVFFVDRRERNPSLGAALRICKFERGLDLKSAPRTGLWREPHFCAGKSGTRRGDRNACYCLQDITSTKIHVRLPLQWTDSASRVARLDTSMSSSVRGLT